MKTILITVLTALLLAFSGKDYRVLVVTTNPQMHCASCEEKIKKNLRFEKGVVKIETDLKNQRVAVTYDPAKITVGALSKAFGKIGYKVKVLSDEPVSKGEKKSAGQPSRE